MEGLWTASVSLHGDVSTQVLPEGVYGIDGDPMSLQM